MVVLLIYLSLTYLVTMELINIKIIMVGMIVLFVAFVFSKNDNLEVMLISLAVAGAIYAFKSNQTFSMEGV